MAAQGIAIDQRCELTTAAKDHILEIGWNPDYGARPLRRTLQREIESHIARMLLDQRCEAGCTIVVDAADGEFTFDLQHMASEVAAGTESAADASEPAASRA